MTTLNNKSESFIRMRNDELTFIKNAPFYGSQLAEKLYNTLNKRYNIQQVSICGQIVSIVHYENVSTDMLTILNRMFPKRRVKQIKSEYTGLITTYTLPEK